MGRSHATHPGPTPPLNVQGTRTPNRRSHALLGGLTVLVAACGGDSSVDPVQVRDLTLTVEPSSLVLSQGENGRLEATLVDDAGRTVPTHDLSWRSSDPSIASVDGGGLVTGVEPGTVTVTASAAGKKQDANVNVRGKGRLDLQLESGSGQTGPVGETLAQPLVVMVRDGTGAGVPGIDVSWKANGNHGSTSASSTTTNQNGLTQVVWTLGATLGSQTVQAQIKGSGWVEFSATATHGSPATVTVSPASASLEVGQGQQFTASAQDRFGNAVPGASFTWSSTAGDVVAVGETGMAKAMSPGNGAVEAWAGGVSGRAAVEVTGEAATTLPGTVTDLAVRSVSTSAVTLGFTQVEDGTGSPADYDVRYAETPKDYRWDTAIPVEAGSCVAPLEGTEVGADLTCSVEGLSASTSYDFLVLALNDTTHGPVSNVVTAVTESGEPAVASVAADVDAHAFTALGESVQLAATARDGAGTPVPDVGFNWSSLDPQTASVDTEGLVVANAVGTTSIVVSALCCAAADTVAVEVTQVPAALVVSPATFSLAVDQTAQLGATVLDAGSNAIEGADVQWSSSDPAVASVDPAGRVIAAGAGTVVIEARSGEVVGTASGDVSQPVVEAPGRVTDLAHVGGGALTWTQVDDGTGGPAHYAIRHGCPTVSWGSAYSTEVSLAGTAIGETMRYETGQASGSCDYQLVSYRGTLNVDAEFGQLSNVATVAVETAEPVATSIDVSPEAFTLQVGEGRQLSATVLDQDGKVMSGLGVVWSSTAPSVATVDAYGRVSALAEGPVTIEARLDATGASLSVAESSSDIMDSASGTVTETSWDGEPIPPSPGSPNVAVDWRAGGAHDIQSADSYAEAKAAGGWGEFNALSPTRFDLTTDFLGDGTRAVVFPWLRYAGDATCEGSGGSNSQHNLGILQTVNIDADEIYHHYKMRLGRSPLDSSPAAVGQVDLWDSADEANGYGRKWFMWLRDLSSSQGRLQMIESPAGVTGSVTATPRGNPHGSWDLDWDPDVESAGEIVTVTMWGKRGIDDGEMKIWINGTLRVHLTNEDTWPEAAFKTLEIGGPTWICPPADQTQYLWDLVIWTN